MILISFFITILSFSKKFVRSQPPAPNWGYGNGSYLGPTQWKTVYKHCGGYRQSPIKIAKEEIEYWKYLKPVTVTPGTPGNAVLLNLNHTTVVLTFNNIWNIGFNNEGCFKVVSMHWHWGSDSSKGSDHSINDVTYPMEGHLTTFNCNFYNTYDEAKISSSGIYVFGILYNIAEDNVAIKKLEPYLEKLQKSLSVSVPEISPADLLPLKLGKYYRYAGSMGYPPCTGNVVWTIFDEIQSISDAQLQLFRSLKYGSPMSGPMVNNFRPLINFPPSSKYIKRVVFVSFTEQKSVPWFLLVNLSTIMVIAHIF